MRVNGYAWAMALVKLMREAVVHMDGLAAYKRMGCGRYGCLLAVYSPLSG
jgi:hypothetical protein